MKQLKDLLQEKEKKVGILHPDQKSSKFYWQNDSYSPLLNKMELTKSLKRNLWSYELNNMLNGFMANIKNFKQDLKFKLSGKILGTSTYVLKTKSNKIINYSIETQEDINEIQNEESISQEDILELEGALIEEYDDDEEIFQAFSELATEKKLTGEQLTSFKEAKIDRILNLDISELNKKINKKKKINLLPVQPKVIYKKLELKDFAEALNDVLKAKDIHIDKIKARKEKKLEKSDLPFLPENFIINAEKKRANFEKRINIFHENLKKMYEDDPISFLDLVSEPSVKELVDTLLIILHLINHKKIEIWKSFIEESDNLNDSHLENNGHNIYISPI